MPEETEDGLTTSMTADVEFENTGRFSAKMTLNFKDPELEATAKVKYRSNWAFKDGYLYDRPKSAVVRSLRVNGRDMRRSRFARDIRANLLEHSLNDKVKVTFASETKMSLISKDSTTHCSALEWSSGAAGKRPTPKITKPAPLSAGLLFS